MIDFIGMKKNVIYSLERYCIVKWETKRKVLSFINIYWIYFTEDS